MFVKRMVSFFMVAVVFSLLSLQVSAASGTLTSPATGLTCTWDSENATAKSASAGTASMTVKGGTVFGKYGKIILTNNSGAPAMLSFDYAVNGSYSEFTVAGNAATSGSYSAEIANGSAVTVYIKSNGFGAEASFSLTNITLKVLTGADITVTYGSLGSVTVAGNAVTSGSTVAIPASGAAFVATPNDGATFLGWITADNKVISTNASYTLKASENMAVEAVFASSSNACFYVGSAGGHEQAYNLFNASKFTYHTVAPEYLYNNLPDAIAKATNGTAKYIVLANNGTLPAGDYTIPGGVTLVIPFDASNTTYTDKSQWRGYAAPTPYRTLTMAEGANLTLNGAMCVAGQHCPVSQDNTKGGAPSGPQGYVNMLEGSTITVNNGGNLYTYGFIYGQGSVTANNGGTVYEIFQVTDFRGATNSLTKMDASKKVLPFSQYYFQNIEVAVRINYGAKLKLLMNMDGASNYFPSVIDCIGTGDGIFNNLDENSYLVKQYDGATDRLKMDLYGNSSFYRTKLTAMGSYSLDTSDYVFAFNSNLDFRIHENSELRVKSDLCAIPGVTLQVDAGAKISIEDGKKAYFYDLDQWGGYVHNSNYKLVPVSYAVTKTYTRTEDDLTDAKLILNGTIDSTNGFLYTTASGADVTSTGAGKIILPKIADDVTYQAKYNAGEYEYPAIAVVSPILTNANGSQTATSTVTGGTFEYGDGAWTKTVCNHEYNDPTYNFAADGSSCTATRTCKGTGCTHSETAAATVTGAVKTAATCTTMGWTTYTATFGVDWATTQTKDVQDIDINADAHADANKDHLCDNGCGKTDIGTCEDGNKDHYCDYGAGVDGGCRDYFGTCSDSEDSEIDKDHVCDYGCGKVWNECSDVTTDSDHNCDVCGKENVTSHSYGEVTYTWTGYTACTASHTCNCSHVETADAATITDKVTTEPTCSATGVRTYTATFSETWAAAQTTTETIEIVSEAHNWSVSYNWEKVEGQWTCTATRVCTINGEHKGTAAGTVTSSVAKAATCTATGNTLYTATFTDASWAAAQTKTVEGDIAALGHDEVSHEAKAPTCSAIGWDAYVTCSRCDYTTYVEKAALGHAEVSHEAKAPTCTAIGWDAYVTCSRCDYTTYAEKAALGHNMVTDAAVAPTCTATGLTEGSHCTRCDDQTVAQETVTALGHQYGETAYAWSTDGKTCTATHTCTRTGCTHSESVNATVNGVVTTNPTCTVNGTTTYTATFSVDWAVQQTTTKQDVEALGHDWATTLTQGETTHWYDCSRCDATKDVAEHSYEWTVTKDATCHEAGSKEGRCACGATTTAVIAATGNHSYSETYTTVDGSHWRACTTNGCIAKTDVGACSDVDTDEDHLCDVCKVKCTEHVYSAEVTPPTHTEDGYTTYTCNCGHSYTGDTVAATGHSYGSVTYSGDGKTSYTAERSCSCDDKQTATAKITTETTAATCTVDGQTVYTATFTEDWAEGKTTTVTLTAPGHTDSNPADHVCDVETCKVDLGDCVDENSDNVCDVCNASLGYTVSFVNYTKAGTNSNVSYLATVKIGDTTVTGDPGAAVAATLGGEGKFTVSCTWACVALIETTNQDGTKSYDKLTAEATSAENTYEFTIEKPSNGMVIVVIHNGDVDADGTVNTADRVAIARAIYIGENPNLYKALSALGEKVADVDFDGAVNTADRVGVARAIYIGENPNLYKALNWVKQ